MLGDCYEAGCKAILGWDTKHKPVSKDRLCQANVINQVDHKLIGHCWIERGNKVFDYSNGRSIEMPKELYYVLGNIDRIKNNKIYKYSTEQVRKFILDKGTYGTWEFKPAR